MLKRIIFFLGVAAMLPWAAWGEFEGGVGMEYFSVQAYTRDAEGRYFQTLIQSTLAKAVLEYHQAGWFGKLTGGITDWRSGGAWEGTGFDPALVTETYLSTWQQQISLEAGYQAKRWSCGLGYSDHALRNDYGDITRLYYRLRAYELFGRVALYQDASTGLWLGGGYAPRAQVEMYHNGYLSEVWYPEMYQVDSAGTGPRYHGTLALKYRDAENWGIDVVYDAGWAQFSNPRNLEEITLRSGSLTGYFVLWF